MVKKAPQTRNGNELPAGFDDAWPYDGTPESRNRRIEENVGLAWAVAHRLKRFAPPGLDVEDLVTAGVFGLIRAVELFEPERGWRFSTYATHAIRQHVRREIQTWTELPRRPAGEPKTRPQRIAVDPADFDHHHHGREPDPADQAEAADLVGMAGEIMGQRECFVLRRRFADDATLTAVGADLDLTRERVRQIEAGALGCLRTHIEAEPIRPAVRRG